MMSQLRRVLLTALAPLVLAILLLALPTLAQGGGAQIRFVHAIPGASAVDVYTDGQLTVSDLAFGQATNYIQVDSGTHHVSVTQTGSDSPLWEQDIDPGADTALTLVAASAADATFQVFQDDLNTLPLGKARLTALNVVGDAPTVDILLADGRPVIPGLQQNQPYGTLDLPAMTYELAAVPAGQPLDAAFVAAQPFNLASGTSYVLVVYGTQSAAQTVMLAAPTAPETAGGWVRIAHAVPGAAAADVYIDNTLVAPSLSFGDSTGYIALPTGAHNLSVRAPGTSTDLATGALDVTDSSNQTVLITGNAEAPAVQVFTDTVSAINPTTSILSLINTTASSTVSASKQDGTPLLGSVAAGASDSALLEPSGQGLSIDVIGGSANSEALIETSGIYGGVYYSAVAVDGDSGVQIVPLPPVSLAQSIGSAPGAQPATPPPTPTLPPPTPTPQPQVVQPTEAPAQPTSAPNSVEIQPQPSAQPTTAGPTARVLLDPGVNLQLRQYPSSSAFSLGLAPSGTTLLVNGREGAPVPGAGTTATPIPPQATEYVDPVTLLQPGEDLDPAQTWLNVTYNTPDGGSITAWVNALYVGLADAQGRPMALRDLPTVPGNRAGQAQNTSIQPPSPTENITYAIPTNVDPGVRVHIRRTPSEQGESLALVPSGTQLELLGVNETRDWAFVRYAGTDSTVTGWVSVAFVTFQRNGQSVDFDRLQELNELNITADDQRGGVITSGASSPGIPADLRNVVAGTVTGLNPDANLHLRRHANDQAESLALLPNDTVMVVSGRTDDSTWLQVTYQNQIGWVSSQYVTLSFNGKSYDIATLPVIETGTATPTATPG